MILGAFVVYILEWALTLLIFYALFKLCFYNSTLHRFNRCYLLGSVVVSMILPLIHINNTLTPQLTIEGTSIIKELRHSTEANILLPDVEILASHNDSAPNTIWAIIIIALFVVYVFTLMIGWTRSICKMKSFIKDKRQYRLNRWIHLVVHDEPYGPFNWINYIIVPSSDSGFSRRASILHEISHVRLLHFFDLFFLLICTVFNPVCWLIMKEIKIVHEYEADDEVINHYHVPALDYQRLLLVRTVGAEAYALASSFNLNIKNRIIMMKKQQTTKWRILWVLVAIPIAGIALSTFAKSNDLAPIFSQAESSSEFKSAIVQSVQEPVIENMSVSNPEEQTESDIKTIETIPDDKNPLVVVDGKIVEIKEGYYLLKETDDILRANVPKTFFDILGIKEDDIESMTVLRGEAAKRLWGNRGENGVIHITTKNFNNQVDLVPPVESGKDSKEEQVYQVVEKMPEFNGGMSGLFEFMRHNIHYPELAKEMQVEGRVLVKFVVNKDGSISDVEVAKGVDDNEKAKPTAESESRKGLTSELKELQTKYDEACNALNEEAVRCIKSMPNWTPGMEKGKTVRVSFTVPINFRLR